MARVFTLAGAFAARSSPNTLFRGDIVRGHDITPIPYNNWGAMPWDISHGALLLNGHLQAYTPPFIVLAFNLGAQVANMWLRDYGPWSSIDPEDVTFILAGDATRKYGGRLYDADENGAPDNTPYDVTNFARQYDGWADWPANEWNFAAVNNALVGATIVHTNYYNVGLDDTRNVVYRDTVSGSPGNIKYVFSPTYPLPVLDGWSWWPEYQREQDATLRPAIETAYRRPVLLDLLSPELSESRRAELSVIRDRVERERNYRG